LFKPKTRQTAELIFSGMVPEARPAAIETLRLRLLVLLPAEIEALVAGDTARAGELASVVFPFDWPEDPAAQEGLPWHLSRLRADPRQRLWRIRLIVERETDEVVGSTSFKGPPDEVGDVEIGWGVNQNRRRRGYAFEAVTAALDWAARQPDVRVFSATIPDHNEPSKKLAQKLGMVRSTNTRRELPLWIRPVAL
jgi:[ribosomal protein S5]-alanine N-acetyltransferase